MECLTPVLFPPQHCQMSISSNSLPPKWTLSLISAPSALSCTPCWGLGLILVTPSPLLVVTPPTLVRTTNMLSSVYSATSGPPATSSLFSDKAHLTVQHCSAMPMQTGPVTLTTASPHLATCSSWPAPQLVGAPRSKHLLPSPVPKLSTSPECTPPKKSFGSGSSYPNLDKALIIPLLFSSTTSPPSQLPRTPNFMIKPNISTFDITSCSRLSTTMWWSWIISLLGIRLLMC